MLDEADTVISVTPLVQKDFQAKTKTPVVLITNGFDEDDFLDNSGRSGSCTRSAIGLRSADARPCPGERLHGGTAAPDLPTYRLVHTGLFAADGNPLNLWDALARRCGEDPSFRARLEIRLAGKVDRAITDAIRARGLGGNLVELGYLPHDETVREQRAADILLLPLRQEPEYAKVLPGKIFEYLAARRPVLGIGQEDGAAAAVLRDAGAGEMFDWNKTDELLAFLDAPHPETTGIEKYTRRALTAQLTQILP